MTLHPSLCVLFVLLLLVSIEPGQALAQSAGPVSLGSGAEQRDNSCALLVTSGSTDNYLRLMSRIGDTVPVPVTISFQIGDSEPCFVDRATPVELHFPKGSFSFRVEPQRKGEQYRFILNKSGVGPVVWFWEIGGICVAVDEAWNYEISCDVLDY